MANLVTLDEFKVYTGIKNPENDDRTDSILASVSSLIKTYCGRSFVDYTSDAYEEYFDGGLDYLYLREFPILEISTVEVSYDCGETYAELAPSGSSGYVHDRRNDRLFIAGAGQYTGINAIKVTYTGGYESIPPDLKLAVYDMTLMYMKAESTPKKTQGFTSVEYITSADFPSHIKRVLDLYRVL